jgi:hypothetical protein
VGWTYDADGNWLSGANRQHTYDAAGRSSTTSWTSGGYFNEFYDGDGRRVKAVEPNLVTYYLRSTVLGGQVIEELTSSGAKQQALIYAGQKVIGHDWANGNVSLLHEDPSGVNVRSSLPQSPFVTYFSELDPWGAEVFSSDPYLDDPEFSGGRGESGPTYAGFGDISMSSTGCMLDGVYSLCDFLRNTGSLAIDLRVGGKSKQFPVEPGLLGILAVWVEDAGKKLHKPQTPIGTQVSEDDVIVTNTDNDGLGHWELLSLVPQNPALNPFLVNRIKQELEESDCAKFAQTILDQLAPGKGRSLVDVFNAFLNQPKPHDLLTRTKPQGSWGESSPIGSIKDSTAAIFARKVDVNQTKADADNIIAELFHLARIDGRYTDKQLANAARRTPYASEAANYLAPSANVFDPGYKPGGWNEQNQYGYSVYFHTIQKQHCGFRPPSPWK